MADTSLSAIRTKVRRLTRSVSEAQLSTTELDKYINTFILYDMPASLRTFSLRRKFTFYTQPYVDQYTTIPTDINSPLYDFKNKYLAVHEPVYIGGYKAIYTQSREQFYNLWPQIQYLLQVGTGDGITVNFNGTLSSTPVLRGQVLFSAVTSANVGLRLSDDSAGLLGGSGNGTIDYVSGAYTLNFTAAPAAGTTIYAQVFPYTPTRPTTMLFFQDYFVLRPVPEKVYEVQIEVDARPSELLNAGDNPELNEMWQYIALGSARKVFQDKMDMESITMLEPEFRQQELFCLRRTIVQNQDQRAATIYSGLGSRYDYGQQWPWTTY